MAGLFSQELTDIGVFTAEYKHEMGATITISRGTTISFLKPSSLVDSNREEWRLWECDWFGGVPSRTRSLVPNFKIMLQLWTDG